MATGAVWIAPPERMVELQLTCAAWLLEQNRSERAADVFMFLQGITLTEETQARVHEMLTRYAGSGERSFTALNEVVLAVKKQLR